MKKFLLASLSLAMVLGISLNAKADITWSGGVTLSGSSDVNTTGVLGAAYNATNLTGGGGVGDSQTVNGVTFTAAETGTAVAGVTGESITFNAGGNNQGAFGNGGFTGDDAALGALVGGGSFNITTVTLGGLTVGDDYLIQTFTQDGRSSRDAGQSAYSNGTDGLTDATAVDLDSITELNSLVGDPVVRIGSFTTGTFTADATSLTFSVFGDGNGSTTTDGAAGFATGNSQASINAIQLRNVTAVPEPSSLAVIGMMAMGLISRRRRK